MNSLTFATSNNLKFLAATKVCRQHGVVLDRATIDLLEIQSNDGEAIARHKAAAAFAALQTPLVVSDDSWNIPGLNGFPGPYMKDVNQWFSPADFLRLTVDLQDRRIILRQEVVYQDAAQQIAFAVDTPCLLLKEIRGSSKYPHLAITSLDGQQSLAEIDTAGGSVLAGTRGVWHEFCEWLNARGDRP
jgi:hypothetical protein